MARTTRGRTPASRRERTAKARSSAVRKKPQPAPARRSQPAVTRRASKSRRRAAADRLVPVKLTGRKAGLPEGDEGGPLGWISEMLETGHTPLEEAGAARPAAAIAISSSRIGLASPRIVSPPSSGFWRDTLLEYKQRKAASAQAGAPVPVTMGSLATTAFVPGARNWVPLGPSVVINGQTIGSQLIGGRVARLAVAPGGSVLYAASSNGGVFRSADGGTTWRSMMDRFDLDPTTFASASLICGAIAIDPNDTNSVYVGSGEVYTQQVFNVRMV